MSSLLSQEIATEFQQSMVDCRQLYLPCGRDCVANYPHLVTKSRREFLEWMDDLHRGLLIKIYCTVALADGTWEIAEQELAALLFVHVWNRTCSRCVCVSGRLTVDWLRDDTGGHHDVNQSAFTRYSRRTIGGNNHVVGSTAFSP